MRNERMKFICRDVHLKIERSRRRSRGGYNAAR